VTDEDLCLLAIGHVEPPRMPGVPDMLRDAWVGFIQDHLGVEDVCFFSGSYSNEYGYPNGLMLARNVQRDFKRFLAAYGFDDREWTCSIEKHPSGRDVLHLHALISGMSPVEMAAFERAWTTSRGWSKAVPCHDGGVRYCCKYALKGSAGDSFEWSW
jgi:hypothetical protein